MVDDDGNVKVVLDFPLFVDGVGVLSGVVTTQTIGTHTVSETSDAGYEATIGGECAADGSVSLALGEIKTCTITNDDIASTSTSSSGGLRYTPVPPIIDLTKVPSPLALPGGSGTVLYAYTLTNIGTVPVNNITLVGDTCEPITRITGDENNNEQLDLSEIWVYNCYTTLTKTHTNTVTAIGWANGISATDIASATVFVGTPVAPPLIHVTKVPSPSILSAGGGLVTYTNKVTNLGTTALSNITVLDDKCSQVEYISGDENSDSKLDVSEIWTYTCQANLTKTTVNTVTAKGEANSFIAKDFAIVTVVVPAVVEVLPNVPSFPNAGTGFLATNGRYSKYLFVGIFSLTLVALGFATRKVILNK